MKIVVDLDKCIAAGSCAAVAPAVFDQRDDDGIVVVLAETPPTSEQDNARLAAGMCPSAAISFEE